MKKCLLSKKFKKINKKALDFNVTLCNNEYKLYWIDGLVQLKRW